MNLLATATYRGCAGVSLESEVIKISVAGRFRMPGGMLLLILAAAASTSTSAWANPPTQQGMIVEKVVMLMRHGVTTGRWADEISLPSDRPFPDFARSDTPLTPHGGLALNLWGQYHRQLLAARGVLPRHGRLSDAHIMAFAAPSQRTEDSAAAMLDGLAPDSGLQALHVGTQAWFVRPMDGLLGADRDTVIQAMTDGLGVPIAEAHTVYRPAVEVLERLFDIPTGHLTGVPWEAVVDQHGARIVPLPFLDHLAEIARMRYAGNLPFQEPGFEGVENQAALAELMTLRGLNLSARRHPRYLAMRHAAPLLARVAGGLMSRTGPGLAPVLLYVGDDANMATVRAVLGFQWHAPDQQPNDIAPGGMLMFERLRDLADGNRFVRISYHAPSMDQIRHLQRLDAATPPFSVTFRPPPGLARPGATMMPIECFTTLVGDVFEELAVGIRHVVPNISPSPTVSVSPRTRAADLTAQQRLYGAQEWADGGHRGRDHYAVDAVGNIAVGNMLTSPFR